eukprot:2483156-Amphidinium_carterae.1
MSCLRWRKQRRVWRTAIWRKSRDRKKETACNRLEDYRCFYEEHSAERKKHGIAVATSSTAKKKAKKTETRPRLPENGKISQREIRDYMPPTSR